MRTAVIKLSTARKDDRTIPQRKPCRRVSAVSVSRGGGRGGQKAPACTSGAILCRVLTFLRVSLSAGHFGRLKNKHGVGVYSGHIVIEKKYEQV